MKLCRWIRLKRNVQSHVIIRWVYSSQNIRQVYSSWIGIHLYTFRVPKLGDQKKGVVDIQAQNPDASAMEFQADAVAGSPTVEVGGSPKNGDVAVVDANPVVLRTLLYRK